MRNMTRQIVCIVLGACLLSTAAAAAAEVVDRIVAVVNDDIITLTELNEALAPFIRKIEAEGFTEEKKEKIIFNLKTDMLERMIDRKLTDQEVRRYNIQVSEIEVDRAIEQFKKAQSITQDDLLTALEQDGLTFEEYRERVKKELVRPKLINYAVKSKIIITDEEIKAFYDAHADDFQGTKKYHLRNIIHTDRAVMDRVLEKLNNGGSFSVLAMKYSLGKNAQEGGELGKFEMEVLSADIQAAVKGRAKGEHTPVISTDQGYQIFYIEDIVMDGKKPFEEASDQIFQLLYNQESEKKFTQWLEELKQKAHIKKML